MYTQIITPDLTVVGRLYWCLEYARKVFGRPAVHPYATAGWNAAQYKHTDALPNVAVPVWFSWTGTVDGVRKDWGHVGVWVPGKGVYTAPVKSTQSGHAVYASPQALASAIGGTYRGWTEDISNVRVVQPQGNSMPTINDDVSRQIGFHFLGRNGRDGRPNALNSRQNDIYGKELSNTQMSVFFLSEESRRWRDTLLPILYAERDSLRETNKTLNTQITKLTEELLTKESTIRQQGAEILGLSQTVTDKQAEIDVLADENAKLRQQLEECGTTPDPDSIVISKSWWNRAFDKLKSFFK